MIEWIKLITYIVAILLVSRYIDLAAICKKAKETATGASVVFLGLCILVLGIVL